ncbi:hypothetical protein COCVIDRAFT_30439 [Bipolaris victoriae FI3]|uniref:Uncharacterized protein n=1 Tax=Bipolaris victoriae (strain FI3) TaxID=930091 RepID=W7E2V3_BIPV3|nr:hypothetical protein COCVIDRAFT_30439 [Bipolaris victoriae FI3]
MDLTTAEKIYSQIVAAIKNKDIEEFDRVVQDNPTWPPQEHWLGHPHDAASRSGLPMFKAFLKHFPQTKDWDCGETGDVVGAAAMTGDIPVLKYCLEELGHNANEGRIFFSPVLYFLNSMKDTTIPGKKAEVIQILEQHGATMEGEPGSIIHQRSHKKRNGKLCWHKNDPVDCPDYVHDEKSSVVEQAKKLFGWNKPGSSVETPASESQEKLAPS